MLCKHLSLAMAVAALGLLGFSSVASAQCCDEGGCCGKKGCTSVPDVRKVAVRCYDSTCADQCVPACSVTCKSLFKGWHCPDYCGHHGQCGQCGDSCDAGCNDCTEGKCSKLHCQQKFLLVKIHTHEEAVRKCVPDACPAGGCAAPVYQMVPPPPPGKGPEVIPAPKGAPGADEVHRPLPMGPVTNVAQ
jgi:hypothetical protein